MNRRPARPIAALLALVLAAIPVGARADGAPTGVGVDEVTLKNGGMLRGTLIAVEPNKQVIILLTPTNESRTVPWAEVDKVNRGKFAPEAAPPSPPAASSPTALQPAPPPASAPPPTEGGPGVVRIHIDTDKDNVTLQRVSFTLGMANFGGNMAGIASEIVCRAPCDRVVDGRAGQDFFFGGEGITPSARFSLTDKGGDLDAQVSAGSLGQRVGGLSLMAVGAGLTVGGGLLLPFSLTITNRNKQPGGVASNAGPSITAIAGSILGVGGAMLVGGIALWATSGTSYTLRAKGGYKWVGRHLSGGAILF